MLTARDNQRATTEAAAHALAVGAEALTIDGATLQSGGWELQAARAPVGQLPQPPNFVATGGDLEGTVDLSWDALRRGVQTYMAQQATSSSGPWTQCYVGKASICTATGLTSGTQYWFQVGAIGAAGPSAWSDPATKRATETSHKASGPGLKVSPRSGACGEPRGAGLGLVRPPPPIRRPDAFAISTVASRPAAPECKTLLLNTKMFAT